MNQSNKAREQWARRARALAILVTILGGCAARAQSAELKPETVAAFDNYVYAREAAMARELRDGSGFLWVDHLPEPRRQAVYTQLRRHEVVIEPINVAEEGKPIKVSGGLIHDWVGVIFIPGATLAQVLAVVRDYDNHAKIYQPQVQRSKVLRREGNDFRIYLRLYRKTIVTVVFNTEYVVHHFQDDATRAHSHSYSTRIAELKNPGEAAEQEFPVGRDHGYLWRLYSYWRFEERDGGVYVQLESLALSRGVPSIFLWLVGPLLKKIPRETISLLLNATRMAVNARRAAPPRSARQSLRPTLVGERAAFQTSSSSDHTWRR